MFQLYSKGCEHAIRALAEAPGNGENKAFSVKAICQKSGLPEWFTRKIFQDLVKKHILLASQGPGGGYRFRILPKNLSLLQIVEAVDGSDCMEGCVMGLPICDEKKSCPLHRMWKRIKFKMLSELRSTTLQELTEIIHQRKSQSHKIKTREI